ncbi:MAG: PRC-barrel domain-containing protein [Methanobacterium sp.]|nr:PRC-barrel domain-containing protein [Methanobacterium sp.]
MRINDFIGMKVIDIGARDVGKIEDLAVTIKECMVEQIFIATGSALSKKYFAVKEDDIAAVGDYVQLKFEGEVLENKIKVDKLDDLTSREKRFKNLEGKVVLAKEGMEIGKIQDMIIDPAGCLIHNVVISMGGTFNRKQVLISSDDIAEIGDYMILKLSKEQIEEMAVD